MIPQSRDTDPKAEAVQIALLCQATCAKRLSIARSLSQTTIYLSRRAIQRANPTFSQREVALAFVTYHYGSELTERLAKYLEKQNH